MSNSILKWYRETVAPHDTRSDSELILAIGDSDGEGRLKDYWDFQAAYKSLDKERKLAQASLLKEMDVKFGSAVHGLAGTAYGLGALAADTIPGSFADPMRDAAFGKMREHEERAGELRSQSPFQGYEDVNFAKPSEAILYGAGLVGEAAPSLMEAVGVGVAGGAKRASSRRGRVEATHCPHRCTGDTPCSAARGTPSWWPPPSRGFSHREPRHRKPLHA